MYNSSTINCSSVPEYKSGTVLPESCNLSALKEVLLSLRFPCSDCFCNGNDKYAGLFAVYDASKEDAERFIENLSKYNMDVVNYTNVDSQEKFEQFFQDHCKNNEIKIEDKEVDTGCCLFNLCGCGNQQNVVN